MMLDGNSAALRDHEQRTNFVDGVFRLYEATARRELVAESLTKITAEQVHITDVWDELLDEDADVAAAQAALSLDQVLETGRVFARARDRILKRRRDAYIEDHLEERVWELHNAPGE